MNAFRGHNGKPKGTEKDKVDLFKKIGKKETNFTMKGGSKEIGGSGFAIISSWFSGKK